MKLLEASFEEAKNNNLDIALELTVPTCEATEIIIVKNFVYDLSKSIMLLKNINNHSLYY